MKHLLRKSTEIFSILALVPTLISAQQGSRLFRDQVDVRVFNLEVVVTDKSGARVVGLGADDFVITVEGGQVATEYFSEIRGGEVLANEHDGNGVEAQTRVQGTSFLVFIDEVFPLGRDRDRAIGHLIDSLSAMGRADQMAVIAFDGKQLEMLTDWTGSHNELRRVLQQANQRQAHGLEALMLEKMLADLPRNAAAERRRKAIERVTLAATSTLRSFAQASGRKAMLLLSGGWPAGSTNTFAVSPTLASLPETLGYRDLYRPLSDTANRLGYTLYTVDMKIFHTPGPSAEFRSSGASQQAGDQLYARDESENSTLLSLASETGGLAFLNSKNRNALAEVATDTRAYYSLGFTPNWQGDDRRRRVRVKTVRPDLKVRARRSFSDFSRQSEVTMMVESALLFGNAPGPASLVVHLGQSTGRGQGMRKTLLPLEIKIPLDGLTFLPGSGGIWQTELELRVAVEDGKGNRNEISVIPVVLTFPERPPAGRHVIYETALKMRKRNHGLVVSLFDPFSGQLFWNRIEAAP